MQRASIVYWLLLSLMGLVSDLEAISGLTREEAIKASFLIGFADYVTWNEEPAEWKNTLRVGVFGSEEFYRVMLRAADRKSASRRNIEIVQIENADQSEFFHFIYVGSRANAVQMKRIVAVGERFGTVTVSDSEGFVRAGGTIEFVRISNRIRFKINRSIWGSEKTQISSKLLRLAVKVEDES